MDAGIAPGRIVAQALLLSGHNGAQLRDLAPLLGRYAGSVAPITRTAWVAVLSWPTRTFAVAGQQAPAGSGRRNAPQPYR